MEARNHHHFSNSHILDSPPRYPPNQQFQSNILNILATLQMTVNKQNMMLQYLFAHQQQMQANNSFCHQLDHIQLVENQNSNRQTLQRNTSETSTGESSSSENSERMIKEEQTSNSIFNLKHESSDQTVSSIDDLIVKQEDSYGDLSDSKEDDQTEELETKEGVRRRNNFKSKEKTSKKKKDLNKEKKRKSNKLIVPKFPPSKSKHLWINYGRRIIDFALCFTKGDENHKIRALVGKLCSKRDFKEIFEVKESDSEEEKEFKNSFAKLALNFIELSAEEAFESSNYRDSLLVERDRVASWLKHVAGLDC